MLKWNRRTALPPSFHHQRLHYVKMEPTDSAASIEENDLLSFLRQQARQSPVGAQVSRGRHVRGGRRFDAGRAARAADPRRPRPERGQRRQRRTAERDFRQRQRPAQRRRRAATRPAHDATICAHLISLSSILKQ